MQKVKGRKKGSRRVKVKYLSLRVLSAAERVRALAGPSRKKFKERLKAFGW